MVYCSKCGKGNSENSKYCQECGELISKSQSSTQKKDKSDEILDFRAVTVTASITFFIAILLYSYTPTFAFIIGALIGGSIMGILFSDKLNSKTRGISGFVGGLIALIILVVLLSY